MSESASPEGKAGVIMTGLMTVSTATMAIWGQQGPGFSWDSEATSWIKKTIPGLSEVVEVVAWPVANRWPFASVVLLTVILLSVMKLRRPAVFLLASIAGGMLVDWALKGLQVPLAPAMNPVFYGTFFGGLAIGLHAHVEKNYRVMFYVLTGLTALLSGVALVADGGLPSAWLLSVLLTGSWLLILHQLMK